MRRLGLSLSLRTRTDQGINVTGGAQKRSSCSLLADYPVGRSAAIQHYESMAEI